MTTYVPTLDDFINEREFRFSGSNYGVAELQANKEKIMAVLTGNLGIETVLNKLLQKYSIRFESGFGYPQFDDMASVGIIDAGISDDGEIIIRYADYFYETFEDDDLFNTFITVFKRTVAHEMTHYNQLVKIRKGRSQYDYMQILSKLSKDPNNRDKYLSSPQEIIAFAVESVEEFRGLGYTDAEILKKIKTPFVDYSETNIFYMYIDLYDWHWMEKLDDPDKKEIDRCKKIIDKFLHHMYMYITKDTITESANPLFENATEPAKKNDIVKLANELLQMNIDRGAESYDKFQIPTSWKIYTEKVKIKRGHKGAQSACYDNALKFAKENPEFKLVIGLFIYKSTLINDEKWMRKGPDNKFNPYFAMYPHAWNVTSDDIIYDVTIDNNLDEVIYVGTEVNPSKFKGGFSDLMPYLNKLLGRNQSK